MCFKQQSQYKCIDPKKENDKLLSKKKTKGDKLFKRPKSNIPKKKVISKESTEVTQIEENNKEEEHEDNEEETSPHSN